MSLPTYNNASGMADFAIRSTELTTTMAGLVSHTSLKKRGRYCSDASRWLKDCFSFIMFLGGLLKDGSYGAVQK